MKLGLQLGYWSAQPPENHAELVAAAEEAGFDTMFTADAIWEMPPFTGWYRGPRTIGTLIHQNCPADKAGDMRLLPVTANGQPGAAMYMRNPQTGRHEPFQLHVLDIVPAGISHVVAFLDTALFAKFGLPEYL